jgi:WXG100 family type VII secretion target
MAQLTVTPSQLEGLSATVVRVSSESRSAQSMLRAQLAPLFGSEWSGAAAAQFAALYEQFDGHARGLADALDGIGVLLGRAGSAYAEVEQQIMASFR